MHYEYMYYSPIYIYIYISPCADGLRQQLTCQNGHIIDKDKQTLQISLRHGLTNEIKFSQVLAFFHALP
jgi:hypothetical protein